MHEVHDDDGARVLLVDDRRENRIALRAVVAPLGLEIVEADSGEQALREVLAQDFAVILLDVQMPGMDGLETAALIKRRERSRDVPIIFLTAAEADVAQVFAGYEAGAVDYLLKPFDPLVLRSKVQVFADLERQRRQLARSDELVRNAFAAAPTGMALADLDGVALRVNPALERLTGRHGPGLLGTPVRDLLRERDREGLDARLAALADGGDEATWGAYTATGVPVTVTLAPVREAGQPTRQVLVQLADERDRRIATTLQRALLPDRLPAVPGLSLAAHISPGGGGTRVGGDWYDAIALPGGRLGVVVGDVAGHGIDAAARMGELRSVARAYALEGHEPVDLVERMNGYHAALGADLMTTMLFAVVEIDTGVVRVVNAGHPPPLLVAPDGTTQVVEGAGPPLGVLETWRYEERVAHLGPEHLAVLYTDGLVERRGERLDEGLARLRAAASAGVGEAGHACDRILSALDAEGADDDVTLVVVRGEAKLGPVARLSLAPDGGSLAALRRVMHRWLAECGADEDEARELVLAANEAFQNALEHGTGFARTTIAVELELHEGEARITVRDAGRRDRSPSDPDRGRGIELMRGLADEVSLELAPHGSVVRLRRALRVGPDRPAISEAGRVAGDEARVAPG
ncbi:MAG: SpoIIE family protein phosphatase [Solirubrobacterales bacterium]|nr:SpoIIE family protein phosphatase [Solirubrobacterales bacterium]